MTTVVQVRQGERPIGAYLVDDHSAVYRPALDVTRPGHRRRLGRRGLGRRRAPPPAGHRIRLDGTRRLAEPEAPEHPTTARRPQPAMVGTPAAGTPPGGPAVSRRPAGTAAVDPGRRAGRAPLRGGPAPSS